jgi:hypothetical protein
MFDHFDETHVGTVESFFGKTSFQGASDFIFLEVHLPNATIACVFFVCDFFSLATITIGVVFVVDCFFVDFGDTVFVVDCFLATVCVIFLLVVAGVFFAGI